MVLGTKVFFLHGTSVTWILKKKIKYLFYSISWSLGNVVVLGIRKSWQFYHCFISVLGYRMSASQAQLWRKLWIFPLSHWVLEKIIIHFPNFEPSGQSDFFSSQATCFALEKSQRNWRSKLPMKLTIEASFLIPHLALYHL